MSQAKTPMTYMETIKAAMKHLGFDNSLEIAFMTAAYSVATEQKTTTVLVCEAIMASDKKEKKDWIAYFKQTMRLVKNKQKQQKQQKQQQQQQKTTTVINTKPVRTYDWNFQSNSVGTKSVTMITPTNMIEPIIYFTPEVRAIIDLLVATCNKEVGWLGTVRVEGNRYTVDKIFIPKQTVSSIETDISIDAMAEIAEAILDANDDTDRLFYWGHSHVNMGVSPSKQDEEQVREYLDACPKFIRSIHNKAGQQKIDFYDRNLRVVFQNLTGHVAYSLSEEHAAEILKTIKDNVREAQYTMVNTTKNNSTYAGTTQYTDFEGYAGYSEEELDVLTDPFGTRGYT